MTYQRSVSEQSHICWQTNELDAIEETYPARKSAQSGFVRIVAAEALKEKEKKRVQKVVVESSLDADLEQALEVSNKSVWRLSFLTLFAGSV